MPAEVIPTFMHDLPSDTCQYGACFDTRVARRVFSVDLTMPVDRSQLEATRQDYSFTVNLDRGLYMSDSGFNCNGAGRATSEVPEAYYNASASDHPFTYVSGETVDFRRISASGEITYHIGADRMMDALRRDAMTYYTPNGMRPDPWDVAPEQPSRPPCTCSRCNPSAYGHPATGYVDELEYNADEDETDPDFGYDPYSDDYGTESGRRLNDWDYTPELVFHGDGPTFFGMEIEISDDGTGEEIAHEHFAGGNVAYLKEDGSVSGFELVTHPMSLDWAMTNFPWEILRRMNNAGSYVEEESNGIHVHVSRDAFTTSDGKFSAAHLHKWLKLLYRNDDDVSRVARRNSDSWAKFSSQHRESHYTHARRRAGAEIPAQDYETGELVDGTLGDRYSAVNCINRNTFEVRVFASTLQPTMAQAALQTVAASVEYARQLTCHDVIHNDGWSWPAFISWASETGNYSALVSADMEL